MLIIDLWRRRRPAICVVVAVIVAFGALGTVSTAAKKKFKADKGPKKIDVRKYPKPYQTRYKLFGKKCRKCHTLARPINTDFTPSKWKKYTKRMRRKPDSGIKPKDAEKIWQFLVYDTKTRKKTFWNKLPESEKKLAKEGFDKVKKEG